MDDEMSKMADEGCVGSDELVQEAMMRRRYTDTDFSTAQALVAAVTEIPAGFAAHAAPPRCWLVELHGKAGEASPTVDLVVVFRGTKVNLDWLVNLSFVTTS